MTIIILALLGSLALPLYFLRLLADGRKLRENTSDHGSWLAPRYRIREDTPSAWPPL